MKGCPVLYRAITDSSLPNMTFLNEELATSWEQDSTAPKSFSEV